MNVNRDTGEVLQGEVVEDVDGELAAPASTQLVPTGPINLLGTSDPGEYLTRVQAMADQLVQIVDKQELFTMIHGKKHIQVQAWTYLGSMVGVFASVVGEPEYVKGKASLGGWKATAEARTLSGALVGRATALCMRDEDNWRTADDHDVMAMAQTRAIRNSLKHPLGFIVQLAGYSADEDGPRSVDQNARFHAMLGKLAEAEPDVSPEQHRISIKNWGKARGFPESTKDWSTGQMTEAMDELQNRLDTAGVPF